MLVAILVIAAVILAAVIFIAVVLMKTDRGRQVQEIINYQERSERTLRDDIAQQRMELRDMLKGFSDSVQHQLLGISQTTEQKLELVRQSVEKRLDAIQQDNNQKLEQMRATVDEKLHATLERRLGESFQIVSDRLERVHQGLGEMQVLASGVGDLKRILTNVKTRGTWGEVQLGQLLEQILTPDQYEKNVVTRAGSKDPVEFAIRLPGRGEEVVWLPIDAKFPMEDYQRLQDAQEAGDKALVEEAAKAVENRIKLEAKKIQEKYIDPPQTTDFGVMFLPTEGLYAEVISRAGLCELLQRDFRIVVAGPTTIAALLNSLQMGFRTLAVEKRASEVWKLLGAVKADFGKFGEALEHTQKKIQEAGNIIDKAATRSRSIERKLNKVQELPVSSKDALLDDNGTIDVEF